MTNGADCELHGCLRPAPRPQVLGVLVSRMYLWLRSRVGQKGVVLMRKNVQLPDEDRYQVVEAFVRLIRCVCSRFPELRSEYEAAMKGKSAPARLFRRKKRPPDTPSTKAR